MKPMRQEAPDPQLLRHLVAALTYRPGWEFSLQELETCEFFQIGDDRPYAPHHGPGNDPYIIFEHGTDVARRTSFRGEVKG